MNTRDTDFVINLARSRVAREWGLDAADRLGNRLYAALLSEVVLVLAAAQDPDIDAETVRRIVIDGRSAVVDETNR
jgi:hypothetical protein